MRMLHNIATIVYIIFKTSIKPFTSKGSVYRSGLRFTIGNELYLMERQFENTNKSEATLMIHELFNVKKVKVSLKSKRYESWESYISWDMFLFYMIVPCNFFDLCLLPFKVILLFFGIPRILYLCLALLFLYLLLHVAIVQLFLLGQVLHKSR